MFGGLIMSRFIKFIPSEESSYLMRNHPNAFLLLCLIAERARRVAGNIDGLQTGDAILGDYEAAGLTRKQYRTALDHLVELGLIKIIYNGKKFQNGEKRAIKMAIKGTLVNILNSRIWDINPDEEGQQKGQQRANRGPTEGHEQERIRKNKKEEEENTHGLRAVGCDVVIPVDFSRGFYKPDENRDLKPPSFMAKSQKDPPPKDETRDETRFYGADKKVKMTQKEYDELLNYMTEKEREYWIDELTLDIGKKGEKEFNKSYKSHYHTIRSWKRYREEKKANSNSPSIIPKNTPLDNKNLAEEIEKNYESKFFEICVLSGGVELVPRGGNGQPDFISYSEKGFKDQFGNLLKKRNFVKKRAI